jgi:hypothetical protein
MTSLQDIESNLKQKDLKESVFQEETPSEQLGKDEKTELNNQEEEEQVNGFELFMQNAKGNFNKLVGCGG